jgi:hypothetical protein
MSKNAKAKGRQHQGRETLERPKEWPSEPRSQPRSEAETQTGMEIEIAKLKNVEKQ